MTHAAFPVPHRPALLADQAPERGTARPLLAALRIALVAGWTVLACSTQLLLLVLPGKAKVRFARFYWSVTCRLIGLSVRRVGTPAADASGARGTPGRRAVFVSNHSSWLDILVLGGQLETCFVSKDAVARWPVIGIVARLGRTVFVSRKRSGTGRERDDLRARLAAGDNLLLFPEGTSSDGARVLPFHSAFFAAASGPSPPLVQPVSVAYDRLGGLPVGRAGRSVFAWYGGMSLAPHAWQLLQCRGLRATVWLHPPLEPEAFASRKVLAQAAWGIVADGAAHLRQNRPPPA